MTQNTELDDGFFRATEARVPLVIGSANASVGMDRAWQILAEGGDAMDAVEAGIRAVEDNPDDHTVGFSGYPNIEGDVELDASLMEGWHRDIGCVGGLKGYRAAITVARAVMERLPHVIVTGDGGAKLAEEIGLEPENLLTDEAEDTWRRRIEEAKSKGDIGDQYLSQVNHIIGAGFDPFATRSLEEWPAPGGTVNLIAVDAHGHIASGASTSGWGWKYPGRLGDTPVIGAGNYCDDRYGAATCTGWGELTVRAGTARAVVANLASGMPLEQAAREALLDLVGMEGPDQWDEGYVNLLAVDRHGNHCALTTQPGTTYVWRESGMRRFEEPERSLGGGVENADGHMNRDRLDP